MSWFSKIFGKDADSSLESGNPSVHGYQIPPKATLGGFEYSYPGLSGDKSIQDLLDWALGDNQGHQAIYLSQLTEEGITSYRDGTFYLPWENCYYLIDSEDHKDSLFLLKFPQVRNSHWKLAEHGTLSDPEFRVTIRGIEAQDFAIHRPARVGAFCELSTNQWLIPPHEKQLLDKVDEFTRLSVEQKNRVINERFWGEIRPLSLKAGASLSKYLKETIVITQDTLDIYFESGLYGGVEVISIAPSFHGAPNEWLGAFDRWSKDSIPNDVDFPTAGGRLQIILSDPVRKVLSIIKQEFPYRKATGVKAQAFVRNPIAFLGDDALNVINADQIEQAKLSAGIFPTSFTVLARQDTNCLIGHAEVIIRKTYEDYSSQSFREKLDAPEVLDGFLIKLNSVIDGDEQYFHWRGHTIDIDGDSLNQLDTGRKILATWNLQRTSVIELDDVYCLDNYGDQIEGIGEAKQIYSPYISKPEKGPWVPVDLIPLVKVTLPPNSIETYIQLDHEWITEFEKKIIYSESAGELVVLDGRLPISPSIFEAKELLKQFKELLKIVNEPGVDGNTPTNPVDKPSIPPAGTGPGNKPTPPIDEPVGPEEQPTKPKAPKLKKQSLILKDNVGQLQYSETREAENRSKILSIQDSFKVSFPTKLRAGIELKPHQIKGLAWLQNLIKIDPSFCRGAILADDMGLGKTLQILSLLASHYERNPSDDPSLIVAPIALMKNWLQESSKFFESFPEILLLHGNELDIRKQPKGQISSELLEKKIDSLLRPNWLGESKIVLTTYEVLRDYEFSLAKQPFSLMVCDEAQKIKTPNSLVTLAAKKQKVRFRIACTGTPVENSLADLWCLFDFIQPGLLGSLQEFSEKYRKAIERKAPNADDMRCLLRTYIDPQMLRRMKEDIASELPKKIHVSNDTYDFEGKPRDRLKLDISPFQRKLYADGLLQLSAASKEEDARKRGRLSFAVLHFMKAVCAEPYCLPHIDFQVDPKGLDQHKLNSPKISWLLNTLAQIRSESEKVIIFTEVRELQRCIAQFVRNQFNFSPLVINGDTDERQDVIDKFQATPGFGVIILSPLAAGFGLNIVEANHVIHFSRTWNPAKEGQATDRAYRIGQKRNVRVYCPTIVAEDFITFEDNLDRLMTLKADLAGDILDGVGSDIDISKLMPNSGPAGTPSDEKVFLSLADVDRLDGASFEILCKLLLSRDAADVKLTPSSGDGGIDLVVLKDGNIGMLCQCKHTSQQSLGWEALKDVFTGSPAYEIRYPSFRFQKVAITNQSFNKKAKDQAEILGIRLIERDTIEVMLLESPIQRITFDAHLLASK